MIPCHSTKVISSDTQLFGFFNVNFAILFIICLVDVMESTMVVMESESSEYKAYKNLSFNWKDSNSSQY